MSTEDSYAEREFYLLDIDSGAKGHGSLFAGKGMKCSRLRSMK